MIASSDVTDRLLDAIRGATGAGDVSWAMPPTPLAGGFWAQMWRVRLTGQSRVEGDLVARVMPDPTIADRETTVQAYLADAGYPTPAVRLAAPAGSDLDRAWMLMEYAPGQPLLSGLSGPTAIARLPRIARALPDTLARHAAALHRIDPSTLVEQLHVGADDIGGMLEQLEQHAAGIDRPDLVDVVERLRDRRPRSTVRVVCHGDLHPFNILSDPAGDTVLDWSATRIAHPAYDIAYTQLLLASPPLATLTAVRPVVNAAGRALARRFTNGYARLAGHAVEPEQLQWYGQLHALRIVTEVAGWRAHGEPGDHAGHPFHTLSSTATRLLTDSTGIDMDTPLIRTSPQEHEP